MMDKSNPMDWVFVLALVQLMGLKYLMAATDGTHLAVNINPRKRILALVVGMLIIWIPYLSVWTSYGFTPVDMWHGASEWWGGPGIIGYVVAIAGWWLLASPAQALVAMFFIRRASQRIAKSKMQTNLPITHQV